MWNCMMNFFSRATIADLHTALEDDNYEKFCKLFKKVNINEIYADFTILQHALVYNKYRYVVALLENGADPNKSYTPRLQTQKKMTIMIPIEYKDESTINLLALYGAKLEGGNFSHGSLLQKIQAKNAIFDRCTLLKQQLTNAPTDRERITIWEELKDIWLNEEREENSNTVYKQHYHAKAEACQREINRINEMMHTVPASQPLLKKNQ